MQLLYFHSLLPLLIDKVDSGQEVLQEQSIFLIWFRLNRRLTFLNKPACLSVNKDTYKSLPVSQYSPSPIWLYNSTWHHDIHALPENNNFIVCKQFLLQPRPPPPPRPSAVAYSLVHFPTNSAILHFQSLLTTVYTEISKLSTNSYKIIYRDNLCRQRETLLVMCSQKLIT